MPKGSLYNENHQQHDPLRKARIPHGNSGIADSDFADIRDVYGLGCNRVSHNTRTQCMCVMSAFCVTLYHYGAINE